MVLVANEGGADEIDNESEPRVERLNGQHEENYPDRDPDQMRDIKPPAKAQGQNKREEPTIKQL